MKMKGLILLFLILVLGFPMRVFAEKINIEDYKTLDIKGALEEEGITPKLDNYSENDKQITIYLFRGKGCQFCRKFLNYVNDTLISKYGSMFKIVSFEVYNDADNSALMDTVGDFFGDNDSNFGIPYIIIGDKTFVGYAEDMNTSIESAITSLYNSSDRYDVFEEIAKGKETTDTKSNTTAIVLWNLVITAAGVIAVIIHNNHCRDQILEYLDSKKK